MVELSVVTNVGASLYRASHRGLLVAAGREERVRLKVNKTQTSLPAGPRLLHLYSNHCNFSLVFLVVLVFGSVFQDAGELHVVEVAFFVNWRFPVHLIHFLVCKAITHCGKELT